MRIYAICKTAAQRNEVDRVLNVTTISTAQAHVCKHAALTVVFDVEVYEEVKNDLKGCRVVMFKNIFEVGNTKKELIKASLLEGRLNQTEVAKAHGVSRAYVSQLNKRLSQ